MSTEVRVPTLPESVSDATVLTWHKQPGEAIARDENLVDLETDKVVLEVPSPVAGVLKEQAAETGAVVTADQLLGLVEAGATASATATEPPTSPEKIKETESAPVGSAPPSTEETVGTTDAANPVLTPAVRRLVKELNIDASKISGTGKNGRILKSDVMKFLDSQDKQEHEQELEALRSSTMPATELPQGARPEERVPMTRLRARIAERLVEAQQNAAILTTFNEVDLQAVMELRNRYKESFEKQHDTRLGFGGIPELGFDPDKHGVKPGFHHGVHQILIISQVYGGFGVE